MVVANELFGLELKDAPNEKGMHSGSWEEDTDLESSHAANIRILAWSASESAIACPVQDKVNGY